MIDLAPHAWVFDGQWLHRPWWKVAINVVLRRVQPWPRKLVVFSRCVNGDERPLCVGYGFGRVLHPKEPITFHYKGCRYAL